MAARGWRRGGVALRRVTILCTTQGRPCKPRSLLSLCHWPHAACSARQAAALGAGGPRIALFRVSGRWRGQRLCNHGGGAARGGCTVAMGASGRSDASHGSSSGGGAGSSGHEAQPGRQRGMHAGSQWGRGGWGCTAPLRLSVAQLKLVARHAASQAPAQGRRRRPPVGGGLQLARSPAPAGWRPWVQFTCTLACC